METSRFTVKGVQLLLTRV